MNAALGWVKLFAAIVLVLFLGEIPVVKEMAARLDASSAWLIPFTIGIAAIGILLLVWGMAGMASKEGHEMTREDFEQLSARTQILGPSKRFSKAWFRGKHKGVVVPGSEWRLADLKAAWREGTLWSDPAMRARLLTTTGGLLFAIGFFGLFVVLIRAPSMKIVLIGALLYALVQTSRAILRADVHSDDVDRG